MLEARKEGHGRAGVSADARLRHELLDGLLFAEGAAQGSGELELCRGDRPPGASTVTSAAVPLTEKDFARIRALVAQLQAEWLTLEKGSNMTLSLPRWLRSSWT